MKTIQSTEIVAAVARLCEEANFNIGYAVVKAYEKALQSEESATARSILQQLLDNAKIAEAEKVPSCQDTGTAVFFVDLGQDVHIEGDTLNLAIEKGVEKGYQEGFLRKSMCDPFTRTNTGNNLPPIIHIEMVPGSTLKIRFAAKGGGSENMSTVTMMKPSDGKDGIIQHVINWVKHAGPNPCPPIIVGIGIGGNFEKSAILAKKSLLRKIGERNPIQHISDLEEELLKRINKLGIGPMGLGGRITALDVHIEYMPCHIASLPVAVNIQCHAARHGTITL